MLSLFYVSIPCNLIPSEIFCFVCRKNFKRLICNSCIILHFYISKNSKLQYSWLWKIIYLHPFYTVVCYVKCIFVLKRLSNYLFFISTMSIINLIYVSQFQNIRDWKQNMILFSNYVLVKIKLLIWVTIYRNVEIFQFQSNWYI